MTPNPDLTSRRSIRLKGFDYSQAGVYFITVCSHDRVALFGEVTGSEVRLNESGQWVDRCWKEIPQHFPAVELDAYVVMPNHVHGIIIIKVGAKDFSPPQINGPPVGAKDFSPPQVDGAPVGAKDFSPLLDDRIPFRSPSRTIGSVIRGFKIGVTKWFRTNTGVVTVWQRNYYEHIIRNEESLDEIREYIVHNPAKWEFDRENPEAIKIKPDPWPTS